MNLIFDGHEGESNAMHCILHNVMEIGFLFIAFIQDDAWKFQKSSFHEYLHHHLTLMFGNTIERERERE